MNSTLEQELTDYLRSEAARVDIHDHLELDAVPLIRAEPSAAARKRWSTSVLVAAAASVVLIAGLAATQRSTNEVRIPVAAAPAGDPAPVIPEPAAPPPALVELPNGATFMGLSPRCTAITEGVYDCTIDEFPSSVKVAEGMTGYVQYTVDNTSHVAGGCRVKNFDGTKLTCYVGQLAVDNDIVGANFLGDWVPGPAQG